MTGLWDTDGIVWEIKPSTYSCIRMFCRRGISHTGHFPPPGFLLRFHQTPICGCEQTGTNRDYKHSVIFIIIHFQVLLQKFPDF
jgi:hypothetical protein